jgi:rubrerythrin
VIFLERGLVEPLARGGKGPVFTALQQAIELEHSTIPPYLYALYSLIPGANDEVSERIESVVIEEMLHLTLAANVLNALGGEPVLNKKDFIPSYPGPLPGSVAGGLVVPLERCSVELIENVFMKIEEPEHPLDIPVEAAFTSAAEPLTIGQFYERIKLSIQELGGDAFVPGPRNQIGPDQMQDSVVVVDFETAARAIDTIVDQGEGTLTEPLEVVGTGFAHYYRFAEIVNGGRLIPNPDAGPDTKPADRYLYASKQFPIKLDPDGVYHVPANPKASTYPKGSVGQVANDTFNYTYTGLLKVLHDTLNGRPGLLDTAIGMMMSLKQLAMDMMSGTSTGNQNIGPSFEYQPVNPGPVTT